MLQLRALLASWMVAGVVAASVGCGTDAIGVDGCRRIEQARCRKAASCPGVGVVHVEACVQFARDQCLHGLPSEPAGSRLDLCVSAIEQATTCTIIETPEVDPACSFLLAGPVAPDASDSGESAVGHDADHDATDADAASSSPPAAAVPDASSTANPTSADAAATISDGGVESSEPNPDLQDG